MKKIIATVAAAVALGLPLVSSPASAEIPPLPPGAGDCSGANYDPVTYPQSWTQLESECGVSFTDAAQRRYVDEVEYLAEAYYTATLELKAQVSAQHKKIAAQRATIKRLRHRLHG